MALLAIDENYPEVLADLARTVYEVLIHQMRLQPEVAGALAFAVAERVRLRMGGPMIRLPMGRAWERSIRDRKIFEAWKAGGSYADLSEQFGLTEIRLRTIIRHQRDLALSRNGLPPASS